MYERRLASLQAYSLEVVTVVGGAVTTGKFQITLPKSVREFLGADKGDFLLFVKDHDAIVVKRGRLKIED